MSYGWRDFGGGHLDELCDECGYDSRSASFESEIVTVLQDLDATAWDPRSGLRPQPDTWSAREYLAHVLELVGETIAVIDRGSPEPREPVPDVVAARAKLEALFDRLRGTDLHRAIDVGGPFPASPAWMLAHLQHDAMHHLLDIRQGYASIELRRLEGPTVER